MGQRGSRFDWPGMQPLPRRNRVDLDERDRLQIGQATRKRTHPKRHSENRERSRHDRGVAAKDRKNRAEAQAARDARREAALAYWRGPIPDVE